MKKIGAGDLVKMAADIFGVKQCPSCEERQKRWNKIKIPIPTGMKVEVYKKEKDTNV